MQYYFKLQSTIREKHKLKKYDSILNHRKKVNKYDSLNRLYNRFFKKKENLPSLHFYGMIILVKKEGLCIGLA